MSDNKSKELEKRVSELESELADIKSILYTPDKEKIYNAKFNLINNPLRFDRLKDPIQIRIKPDKLIKPKYPDSHPLPQLAFILDTLSTGKLLARLVGGDDRLQISLSNLCRIYIVTGINRFWGFDDHNMDDHSLHFEGDGIYRTETKFDYHTNTLIHDENKYKKIRLCLDDTLWCDFYWDEDEISYAEAMDKYNFDRKHLVDEFGEDLWIDVTIGYKYGYK